VTKYNGAIGVNDDGEIEQYEPGKVPAAKYRVIDPDGTVREVSSLEDDTTDKDWEAMLDDDDSDLELGDDDDDDEDDGSSSDEND
jgi:hypothetical protein